MKNEIYSFVFILLFINTGSGKHFEKFFEISGGPEYMYYYTKFQVGTPTKYQSAIIDTGSDTLAFPCDHCMEKNCGTHKDPRFNSKGSKTFNFEVNCPVKIYYHKHHVCQFIKTYAEGSTLLGFLADDYIRFKNANKVEDHKIDKFNTFLTKDLRLKAEFGCTTKETGLFKSQYADGILGLDDGSSLISSMENDNSLKGKKVFSFGLCFHRNGGIMSIDLRHRIKQDDKITMLNKDINEFNNPIRIPYITENNYYEIPVSHFELNNKLIYDQPINMMIDSGTTFSHFPSAYLNKILDNLTLYCTENTKKCGMIPEPNFRSDSCLELRQPDDNFKNLEELLDSFPPIYLFFKSDLASDKPYVLHPKNYFYQEYLGKEEENKDIIRICLAIKGEQEGKIILGAFSMIDYYFYFDRKDKEIKIFKENCFVRTKQLLEKKERILEAIVNITAQKVSDFHKCCNLFFVLLFFIAFIFAGFLITYYFNKKNGKTQTKLKKENSTINYNF
jgi:hypothetical protein